MNYSQLSKAQKRAVDAFVYLRPELATAETISRTDIEEIFWILHAEREHGGEKIGYPMWLVKGEKAGRGMYKFPAPELAQTPAKAATAKAVEIKFQEEDKEFFTELAENGIMETA
jgi:hypothetical protein